MNRDYRRIKMTDGSYIPLQDYIERIFNEREAARNEAAKVLQVHLENLNHWKEETLREREKLVTKEFYHSQHDALLARVDRVEARQSKLVGVGIALIAGAGVVGAFLSHLLKP